MSLRRAVIANSRGVSMAAVILEAVDRLGDELSWQDGSGTGPFVRSTRSRRRG
jgi:hypothetical protein